MRLFTALKRDAPNRDPLFASPKLERRSMFRRGYSSGRIAPRKLDRSAVAQLELDLDLSLHARVHTSERGLLDVEVAEVDHDRTVHVIIATGAFRPVLELHGLFHAVEIQLT